MSYKTKTISKICGDRYQKHSTKLKCHKVGLCAPKTDSNKCFSAGTVCNISKISKPKKTTMSESVFNNNDPFSKKAETDKINYCKTCGDTVQPNREGVKDIIFTNSNALPSVRHNCGPVEQYYINENFQPSTASMQGAECFRKVSLMNTINEQSEENSESGLQYQEDSSKDEMQIMESDIQDLKQFRNENYFECHSTASKIKSKHSVTSLNDHKCVYRFYLNERLFPVPVNTDYNNLTRCTECQLPLEILDSEFKNFNGTIQAKVKINGQLQDMMLMLPVKKTLIIKERRKELQERKEEDNLYFGIVKLSMDGDSLFTRNLPSNSLALRYQKGYQEHRIKEHYQYECINSNDDVIII